jgi:hypothetical protein
MKQVIAIIIFLISAVQVPAQFAPAAGETGSTAIHKDNSLFSGWAKNCKVTRGFINFSDTTVTYTQGQTTSNRAFFGTEAMATGQPGGPLDCISLGDGGIALLTFDYPIKNGSGADFAVFENGIREQESPFQYFLELAFVEVSTDGKRFVRFPAVSNVPATQQLGTFGQIDPKTIHNFAGKYVANYGAPFDLEELKDSTGINIDSINFIRLLDVVGSIDPKYARYDSKGQVINDPFPTEFWTGGFDLDAVGVIHFNRIINSTSDASAATLRIYPNPVNTWESVNLVGVQDASIQLWSQSGRKLATWETHQNNEFRFSVSTLSPGLYMLVVSNFKSIQTIKLMVK